MEKARYQSADGQASLFDDDSSFSLPEPTEEQSQQTATYTVVRKICTKKRNNSLREDIETEMIHHHPENTICNCCHNQMVEIGSTIAREEATFIPAKMMRVQHIEHAYECKACKRDTLQQAQIKRVQAPKILEAYRMGISSLGRNIAFLWEKRFGQSSRIYVEPRGGVNSILG